MLLSLCLASSQQGLAGEASRLYLFINLLGTGNERQGQYIILSVLRAHTLAHARTNTHTHWEKVLEIQENPFYDSKQKKRDKRQE